MKIFILIIFIIFLIFIFVRNYQIKKKKFKLNNALNSNLFIQTINNLIEENKYNLLEERIRLREIDAYGNEDYKKWIGNPPLDEKAIDLACRFGYSIPNAYKSLGGALKELIDKTRKKKKRSFFEDRLDALRKSAEKARSELSQQEGSEKSVSSENVYGQ